jgi:hypothetical protein
MFSVVLFPTLPQKPLILCKPHQWKSPTRPHLEPRKEKGQVSPRPTKNLRLWIKPNPKP